MSALVDRLKDILNPERNEDIESGVFKAMGDGWWFAAYTNNIKDREKEILSTAAHDRYIARVKAGFVPMPELWFWHLQGTRHGKALWIDRVGHVVYAIGKFDDTAEGKEAERTYKDSKPGSYQLSHGFKYPKWAKSGGVYEDYNTFEITTLPVGKATPAALFTEFEVVKEMNMPVSEQQLEELRKVSPALADKFAAQMNTLSDKVGKAVNEFALETKAFDDFADLTAEKEENAQSESVTAKALEIQEGIFEESVGELLSAFEKSQKATQEILNKVAARDKQRETEHAATLKELRAEIEAVKGLKAELKAEKDLAPQRVADAEKSVDEDSEEGKEAAEAIEKQRSGGKDDAAAFFNP